MHCWWFSGELMRIKKAYDDVTQELNETKSQVVVAEYKRESDIQHQDRKAQEEIASLQQLVHGNWQQIVYSEFVFFSLLCDSTFMYRRDHWSFELIQSANRSIAGRKWTVTKGKYSATRIAEFTSGQIYIYIHIYVCIYIQNAIIIHSIIWLLLIISIFICRIDHLSHVSASNFILIYSYIFSILFLKIYILCNAFVVMCIYINICIIFI